MSNESPGQRLPLVPGAYGVTVYVRTTGTSWTSKFACVIELTPFGPWFVNPVAEPAAETVHS